MPTLHALIERALAGNPSLASRRRAWRAPQAAADGADARRRPQVNGDGRRDPPALQRERHLPAAAGRLDAHQRHAAGRRALGARLLRPQPRRARGGDRHASGPRRPTCRPRASCWPATSRAATCSWPACSSSARSRSARWRSATKRWRWSASACRPASTPALELRQGEGALPEARQQIEALDEQIALARHALAALTAQPPDALDALVAAPDAGCSRCRCRPRCRPTCSAAAPTSRPRAGASRPRRSDMQRGAGRSSIRTST